MEQNKQDRMRYLGIGRCYSRRGRYKVLHVHESDLYMGNRDAAVIFGGIRVETSGGTGRGCSSVGPVVQRDSGILEIPEL